MLEVMGTRMIHATVEARLLMGPEAAEPEVIRTEQVARMRKTLGTGKMLRMGSMLEIGKPIRIDSTLERKKMPIKRRGWETS